MKRKSVWKKGLALLLVCVMALGIVGCSPEEEAYMKLSMEPLAMELGGVHVDVTCMLDYDVNNEWLGEYYAEMPHMEYRVIGDVDLEDAEADLEIMYRKSDHGTYQPLTRIMTDGVMMCMSTEGIWRQMKQRDAEMPSFSADFIAEMDSYIGQHPFIFIDMADTMAEYDYEMDLLLEEVNALNEVAGSELAETSRLLKDYLAGYTSGLVSAKASGYELRLDVNSVLTAGDNLMAYLKETKTSSYELAASYMKALQKMEDMEEFSMPSHAEWSDAIDEITDAWPEMREDVLAQGIDPDDHISHWIKAKEIDGHRAVEQKMELAIEEIGMTLTVAGTITQKDVTVVPTPNAIDLETFMADIEAITQKYTELKRIELVPVVEEYAGYTGCDADDAYDGDFTYTYAEATIYRDFCGQPNNDWWYVDMKYIGQRYYIDADDLAYILPEAEVEVVDDTHVSITYNGRSVTLAAVTETEDMDEEDLIYLDYEDYIEWYKTTYIAVRDLEALGFTLTYQAEPEMLTLTPIE